jgi:hypothetical protein
MISGVGVGVSGMVTSALQAVPIKTSVTRVVSIRV